MNKPSIVVRFVALADDGKVNVSRLLQPLNIYAAVVAELHPTLVMFIVVSFSHCENQFWNELGCTSLNEASNTTVVRAPFTVSTHPGVVVPVAATAFPLHTPLIVCPLYVLPGLYSDSANKNVSVLFPDVQIACGKVGTNLSIPEIIDTLV